MITRNLFIRLTNNKRKPWNKIELQKICKSLSLRTTLTNKEMYSNIKSFYHIKNKVLLHDWKLNELKETLVITTGDNYVGMAKRQLREKMADLYSKIASSYDKPSENELNNLSLIEDEFNRAKIKFNKLKKKVKIEDLSLKSFDEFISE